MSDVNDVLSTAGDSHPGDKSDPILFQNFKVLFKVGLEMSIGRLGYLSVTLYEANCRLFINKCES